MVVPAGLGAGRRRRSRRRAPTGPASTSSAATSGSHVASRSSSGASALVEAELHVVVRAGRTISAPRVARFGQSMMTTEESGRTTRFRRPVCCRGRRRSPASVPRARSAASGEAGPGGARPQRVESPAWFVPEPVRAREVLGEVGSRGRSRERVLPSSQRVLGRPRSRAAGRRRSRPVPRAGRVAALDVGQHEDDPVAVVPAAEERGRGDDGGQRGGDRDLAPVEPGRVRVQRAGDRLDERPPPVGGDDPVGAARREPAGLRHRRRRRATPRMSSTAVRTWAGRSAHATRTPAASTTWASSPGGQPTREPVVQAP